MSRRISLKTAVATASVSMFAALAPAFAQEEEATAAEETPAAEVAEAGAADKAQSAKAFYPLMRCERISGSVQLLKPRTEKWVDAVEGRYYPLGSAVRVAPGAGREKPFADFAIGDDSSIVVSNSAEYVTREAEPGSQSRAVDLRAGCVMFKLNPKLAAGQFKVVTPSFTCEDMAGESVFDYQKMADGEESVVRCVTGKFALKGNHYVFPEMLAANQLRVRSTGDMLFTSIRCESGVCKMKLDQGMTKEKNFVTGEVKDVQKTLDFALSPQCSVKIFRSVATIGGRVSVTAMTFSPSGEMLNRCAFAEGLANINSGEMVIAPKIPDVEKPKEKADEDDDAEEVEVAAPAEKAGGEEKAEKEDSL